MARPRGFIDNWQPKEKRLNLIDSVNDILLDNADIRPLTLRQIFYMLVTGYGYDKTEKAYKQLCEAMNMARRARRVDMDDIRDDGLTKDVNPGWQSRESFLRAVLHWTEDFKLDRQLAQEIRTYVWCEAGGMVPQLASAMEEFDIPVLSSGGFDSVTTKHNFAKEISDSGGKTMILHLGDHDPSGVHMFGSLDEDLQAFVRSYGGDVELRRIAVTPEQVEEMNLPTAPPKTTDNRSFSGLTTQCEAIPPRELRRIVTDEVLRFIDLEALQDTKNEEVRITEEFSERFEGLL
ncbi:MAG: hypothetical protein ABJN40_05915 [Sneathiella sp.]